MNRRAALLLAAAALMPLAAAAQDQAYPARPVRIIVPYPPGGTTDILARLVAARLTDALKQGFVVENRAGASGSIGSQAVAKAPPDGYTLLMGTLSSHGINTALQKALPYDPVRDFAQITIVAATPNVIAVHPGVPARNLGELLALARANPGKVSYGSTSHGGSPHLSAELLKAMAKVDMVHVPYKGAGPMLTDLMGGQIQVGFDNLPSTIAHIRSGKLRGIAVTTATRWPGAPELPTVAESGVPGYEVSGWFGLFAPAGTPPAVVSLIHQTVVAALKQPEVAKQLAELGADPVGNTPEEFRRQVEAEVRKWRGVVEAAGIKTE